MSSTTMVDTSVPTSPLEVFLRRFTPCVGGILEDIEPQVYDMLLPSMSAPLRVTIDPEALADHPGAQLVAFGSPVLDDFLEQARSMGKTATVYVQDMNLEPYGIAERAKHDFILPQGVTLVVERSQPRHVAHLVFFFKVTYLSDTREEMLHAVALDCYYGRQTKHIVGLTETARLVEQRLLPLPDAEHMPLGQVYFLARGRLLRTLSADANTRNGELQARLSSQRERLHSYYRGLNEELDERQAKLQARGEDVAPLEATRKALRRDEAMRMEEIDQQSMLRAEVCLVNVLHLKAPRLFLSVRLTADPKVRVHLPSALNITWDLLAEHFDAVPCPKCQSPTFQIIATTKGEAGCPSCTGTSR